MLKEEKTTEREPKLTRDDQLHFEEFCEVMARNLIDGLGEEVMCYVENN